MRRKIEPITSPAADPPLRDEVPRKTRVFLSYSRHDQEMADWLRKELDAAGFELFRDSPRLANGKSTGFTRGQQMALVDTAIYRLGGRGRWPRVLVGRFGKDTSPSSPPTGEISPCFAGVKNH